MTLLQAWIYEYFPMFRPQASVLRIDDPQKARARLWASPNLKADPERLVILRRALDDLVADQVNKINVIVKFIYDFIFDSNFF